jgi:type II secretory pathway component PulF
MNYDEFAFFNQQLGAMLRDGLPLEGSLKQLSVGMNDAALRGEVEKLGADLAQGTPLDQALARRALPPFYVQMLRLGARANDLPGVLTLLADYYHKANAHWTRLKGLLIYPVLVVAVSLGLTLTLTLVFSRFFSTLEFPFGRGFGSSPGTVITLMWLPPILLGLAMLAGIAGIGIPKWRGWLRWRLPAFREASLAELASAMALMLKNGTTLADALAMAADLEANTPAAPVLAVWRTQLEAGQGKPIHWNAVRPFPPLFLWFVQNSGEDIAIGFQKAAQNYHDRASHRIELALYGALPISILVLGQMVLWQAMPLVRTMITLMNAVGDNGS